MRVYFDREKVIVSTFDSKRLLLIKCFILLFEILWSHIREIPVYLIHKIIELDIYVI